MRYVSVIAGVLFLALTSTLAFSQKAQITFQNSNGGIQPVTPSAPLPVTASGGTQDINLKNVNGAAVNVGAGAAGTGTQRVITSTDSTIGTVTAVTGITNALPAGTNLLGKVGVDQTTPGTSNLVSAGFTQQVASDPTVQNAAYASGNCIGSFNAVTVTANNGQSGLVTNFRISSIGGSTPTLTLYLFDSNPSASTCTDKSTFTLNSADVDKLISLPIPITLAAPTGTTVTFGSADFTPARPFIAGGSAASGVKTIYYGLVSGTIFTPAATTDIHTRVGVALN